MTDILSSFTKLKQYVEHEGFKGWDPYDGLNSKIFQSLPFLRQWPLARLVMIQFFKRCPVNLRHLFLVPKDFNAKGIGLLLQGYCNLFRLVSKKPNLEQKFGTRDAIGVQINKLSTLLLSLRSRGNYHGDCWGYNFDWQARLLFLFPKNTPTVVATTFAAMALFSAYEITGKDEYLKSAVSAGQFVMHDLHRTPCNDGFLFSYSPLEGNDTVFNASMLGSALLARCWSYTHDDEMKNAADASLRACCNMQRKDGSWVYGMLPVQSWIDSFHTGYNLVALHAYEHYTGDEQFHNKLEIGLNFYLNNFFEADGCPKYYNNRKFPIDIHCPAQLFVTLHKLGRFMQNETLADKVMNWTINNMQSKKGFFYYQLKKHFSSKISYMRWSNAFMFFGMSYYLLDKETVKWRK